MKKLTKLIKSYEKMFKFNRTLKPLVSKDEQDYNAHRYEVFHNKDKIVQLGYSHALPGQAKKKKPERAGLPGRHK